MSRNILYVDDLPGRLNEFRQLIVNRVVSEHLAVRVDLARGLVGGLARLNHDPYDFVFIDEDLESRGLINDLCGAEYLQKRARILSPGIIAIEFVSGMRYNRRVVPDHHLMKPMCYRVDDIREILEKSRTREREYA